MIIPVTGVFAAVLGLLLLALSARVVKYRLKYRKGLGVTDDRDFEVAVRRMPIWWNTRRWRC